METRASRCSRWIDRLNEVVGRLSAWMVLAMVLIGAYNAVARYVGRAVGLKLSSNLFIELQWYLFSLVFLLGAAYTLKHGGHVRVDVVYSRLSPGWQRRIDTAGTLVFLVPFCVFGWVVSWPSVRNSWAVLEGSPDPGGLPRYPIKSVILVAFTLLALQGLAGLLRRPRTPDRERS